MAFAKVEICGVNTSELCVLSDDEKKELLIKSQSGDFGARHKLICGNLKLVLSVIQKFIGKKDNNDDIFQVGCIGLVKAVDNFNVALDVKFSTYAVPMIIGEIKRLLRDGNSMRISRSIRDTAYQVLKTRGELEKQDKDSSLENVASQMNVALSEVVYALDAISDTVSLYDPVFNKNGDELLLVDQIGDEKCTDENWTEKVAIDSAMNLLGDREKTIVYLRYYEGKTQTEISEQVGISQAQVSRLEKNALKEIKDSIRV